MIVAVCTSFPQSRGWVCHAWRVCTLYRFIISDRFTAYDESIDSFSELSHDVIKQRETEHQNKLLEQVNFDE